MGEQRAVGYGRYRDTRGITIAMRWLDGWVSEWDTVDIRAVPPHRPDL
ncbi:MAG: hypothetical protein WC913_05845 [Desulfuromonas sp.]